MKSLSILGSKFLLVATAAMACLPAGATTVEDAIEKALAGDHREAENRVRDRYRHPLETLLFLGLEPDMSVVEIWPGGGWYTEILAPVLRGQGSFYAADIAASLDRIPGWRKDMHRDFMEKMETRPDIYDRVMVTELTVPEQTMIAPEGSADMVLTFRNVHNWVKGEYAQEMFNIFYRTLRPGGILGVVEHRANPGTSIEAMKESGYVSEEHVISLATRSGFRLEAKSDVNANPADTKDHPVGVWTLPPTLRYCKQMEDSAEQNRCLARYRDIGESDRMTLRFRKPE